MTKRIHGKSLASLALSSALVLSPMVSTVFAEEGSTDNENVAEQVAPEAGEVSFEEVEGDDNQNAAGADNLEGAQADDQGEGDIEGETTEDVAGEGDEQVDEEELARQRAEELAAEGKLEIQHNFVTLEAAQEFGEHAQEEYPFIKGFEASYDMDTEGVETATVILIAVDDAEVEKIQVDEETLELSYEGGYGDDVEASEDDQDDQNNEASSVEEESKDDEQPEEQEESKEDESEQESSQEDESQNDDVSKDDDDDDVKEPEDEKPQDKDEDKKPEGEKPLDDNKDKEDDKTALPDAPTVDNKVPSFNTLEDAQAYAKAQLDKHSFLTAYEITQARDGQYEVHFKANLSEGQVLDFDEQGNPMVVGGEEKKEEGVRYTLTQQFASQAQAEDYGAKFLAANPDYVLDYEVHKSDNGYSVTFTVVEGYAIAESDQGAKVVMLPKHADGQYAYASLEAAQLRANELKQEFASQVKDIEVVQNDDGTYSLKVTFEDGYDGNFVIRDGVETLEITRTPADAVGPHTQGPTGFVPTGAVNQPAGNTPLPNAIANPNARMAGNMGKQLPGQALPTAGEAVGVLGGIGAVVSAAGAGVVAFLKRRR